MKHLESKKIVNVKEDVHGYGCGIVCGSCSLWCGGCLTSCGTACSDNCVGACNNCTGGCSGSCWFNGWVYS